MTNVIYDEDNVLVAAQKRVSYVFDEFENIYVSVSGGKDSTIIYNLFLREAIKRQRSFKLFFLDQEAEYEGSIEILRKMMLVNSCIVPQWYQVPVYMTNSTSYTQEFLMAWGDGEKWLREKETFSIHAINKDYPKRFYEFFPWLESGMTEKTAFVIGLRSKESLNRFRAVTKTVGYQDIFWSTKTENDSVFRFYPIFDWGFGDVWKFITDNGIEYNAIYDKMFRMGGVDIRKMRISNLIHEKAYKSLASLQILEPDNFNRVIERINGAHCASIYAREKSVYSADELPVHFNSWLEYRDYILDTSPISRQARFAKRFSSQAGNETVYQQQVKQLLINDWENNVPVKKTDERWREKWRSIL